MKNGDEQTVELDGQLYKVVFSSDLDDVKRAEWGMPARARNAPVSGVPARTKRTAGVPSI